MSIVIRGKRLSSVLVAALLVGSGLFMILPAIPTAGATSPQSCGTTIYHSTTLTKNLNCDEYEYALAIGSNGITLNCAGHSISGVDSEDGVLVAGWTGVTIKDCKIVGFEYGIYSEDYGYNTFVSNTLADNDIGIFLWYEVHDTISSNTVSYSEYGYVLYASLGNTVIGNQAAYTDFGYVSEFGAQNFVKSNIFTPTLIGFTVEQESYDNFVSNTANYAYWLGFEIYYGSFNSFTSNEANSNTAYYCVEGPSGLAGFPPVSTTAAVNNIPKLGSNAPAVSNSPSPEEYCADGFVVYHELHDTFTGNSADNNAYGAGIDVEGGSYNVFQYNVVNSNGYPGFYIADAAYDTLTQNTATYNSLTNDEGYPGFMLYYNCAMTLTGNAATLNGGPGFYTYGEGYACGTGDTWSGNTASQNGEVYLGSGFYLSGGSAYMSLSNNLAKNNAGDGFTIALDEEYPSFSNTFTSNVATLNGGYGINDGTSGSGTLGTANTYVSNSCSSNTEGSSYPTGLC